MTYQLKEQFTDKNKKKKNSIKVSINQLKYHFLLVYNNALILIKN